LSSRGRIYDVYHDTRPHNCLEHAKPCGNLASRQNAQGFLDHVFFFCFGPGDDLVIRTTETSSFIFVYFPSGQNSLEHTQWRLSQPQNHPPKRMKMTNLESGAAYLAMTTLLRPFRRSRSNPWPPTRSTAATARVRIPNTLPRSAMAVSTTNQSRRQIRLIILDDATTRSLLDP
jgi:hypothetical protein